MSGAAWNPKKKTPEQEWEELVIMKNEYPDIMEVPTFEEYRKQRWEEIKGTSKKPETMLGCWGFNLQLEKEYKKKYQNGE